MHCKLYVILIYNHSDSFFYEIFIIKVVCVYYKLKIDCVGYLISKVLCNSVHSSHILSQRSFAATNSHK